LLDVPDEERRRRLNNRDPGRWDESSQQAFLGWAQWHREHAVDPRARWPTESCYWLALTMDMKLEVIGIPVSNVDAALTFYTERIGFHLDHDVQPAPGMRVVQMTPPGSSCSVVMGEGMPLGEPGSTKGMQLVVEDIDALRADLAGRGVEITDVQQLGPEGTPGSRFAFFSDLDGNGWSLQEIKRSS
jgi:catechol 2,3-dioxygenase-like lactoylglutathione lyase family enzyme